MDPTLSRLAELKLIPIIVTDDPECATPLADALLAGGLPCAEVTFRTAAAAGTIKNLAALPDLLVGAGTVLTIDQAKQAIDAGARFIVTPGFDADVVDYCRSNGIPIAPGVCTPTDVQAALRHGVRVLKFFPAEAMGGVPVLKALAGPFVDVQFIPTGGVSAANLRDYLALPSVIACGGSWMVKHALIQAGDYSTIATLVKEAVALAH
jgi:2-dehydro-3-deoxyphosphogluconate aldolase/(4S)-4-hydroxy-2-oxoglutarate aldolase